LLAAGCADCRSPTNSSPQGAVPSDDFEATLQRLRASSEAGGAVEAYPIKIAASAAQID
jgi:hypothetical protein